MIKNCQLTKFYDINIGRQKINPLRVNPMNWSNCTNCLSKFDQFVVWLIQFVSDGYLFNANSYKH